MMRSVLRAGVRRPMGLRGAVNIVRYNSTKQPIDHKNPSLTAQVFPLHKENITEGDVDEWLDAVKHMRSSGVGAASTEPEVYVAQLAQPEPFLADVFEPTPEQLAEVEAFANKKIPLPNEPMIENFTNLIMRHGKKLKAHKVLSRALYMVYLHTRQDPMRVLAETLDRLGPLMTTKVEKTGAAKNRTVPVPLNQRQRNRYAITWLLEGAAKKKSSDLSVRLADELIAAYEGKSSGYDRKAAMHKQAIAQRAYIRL